MRRRGHRRVDQRGRRDRCAAPEEVHGPWGRASCPRCRTRRSRCVRGGSGRRHRDAAGDADSDAVASSVGTKGRCGDRYNVGGIGRLRGSTTAVGASARVARATPRSNRSATRTATTNAALTATESTISRRDRRRTGSSAHAVSKTEGERKACIVGCVATIPPTAVAMLGAEVNIRTATVPAHARRSSPSADASSSTNSRAVPHRIRASRAVARTHQASRARGRSGAIVDGRGRCPYESRRDFHRRPPDNGRFACQALEGNDGERPRLARRSMLATPLICSGLM